MHLPFLKNIAATIKAVLIVLVVLTLWGDKEGYTSSVVDAQQQEDANNSARAKPEPPSFNRDDMVAMNTVFSILELVCKKYADKISKDLSPPVLKLFLAWAGVLLVWKLGIIMVVSKDMDAVGIFKLIVMITVLSAFLGDTTLAQTYFFDPLKEMTLNISLLLIQGTKPANPLIDGSKNIKEILKHVDDIFFPVYESCWGLMSFFNPLNLLLGFLAMGVFLIISWMFLFYVADLLFGLMAVSALSPLFIAGYLFPVTRSYSESVIRMAVCCCLTVIFASLSLGICLELTTQLTPKLLVLKNETLIQQAKEARTWSLLCIGFLSLLFMRKSAHMAASITGSSDSGTSGLMIGASMAAIKMGTMAIPGGAAVKTTIAVGKKLLGMASDTSRQRTPMYKND